MAEVVVSTKLRPPVSGATTIERGRLLDRLAAGPSRRVVLLGAPPGSGKTSLLARWVAAADDPGEFAWLSVDGRDNDPTRFWAGAIEALGVGGEPLAALTVTGGRGTDVMLPLLINELSSLERRVRLVLDDYHLITAPEIHEAVTFLIEHQPETLQLVIASRSDPPLPLARLRAHGELMELRASDLRFTEAEADELLNGALELGLSSDQVARLQERTEGWAAGLQLAGISLAGRDDREEFISSFAGDNRHVVDYLTFEVLDSQPGELRDFLLGTSVLGRLSGPLCDAVTEGDRSAALLEELEHKNLFLVALDSRREWYRYHQLFGDLLRSELERTSPRVVPELHRRAAVWHAAEGSVAEAVNHAIAAADVPLAAALISEHWYEFLSRGRLRTVTSWIDALDPELVASSADLCLIKCWCSVNEARLDELDRWLEAAAAAVELGAVDDGGAPLEAGVASVRAIHRYMSGNVAEAVAEGRRALELERARRTAASQWRPVGCPVLGLALFWHGETDAALTALAEAVGLAQADGNRLAELHALGGLATIHLESADRPRASELAERALGVAREHGLEEHWATALTHFARGKLMESEERLDEASETIDRGVELSRRGVATVERAYGLMSLAEVRARLGEAEVARSLIRDVRSVVGRCGDPGVLSRKLRLTERGLDPAARPTGHARRHEPQQLSERELTVLRLLRTELTQREIGDELYVSLNTVKSHTKSIFRKLGASSRPEAVEKAGELDLL